MSKKTQSQLDLLNKKDVVRTAVRTMARISSRSILNELEDGVEEEHKRRVEDGEPTAIDFADAFNQLVSAFSGKRITDGSK